MQEDPGSNLLHGWIARAAERAPDKPWVVSADDGRTVSYRELRATTGHLATLLRQRGIAPNDRVALLANNSIEQLLCYFGVMVAGATVCTIHVEMNRNQLGNIFARLKPKLILYQDGLQLDALLAATSAPRLRLGRWHEAARDTLFAELARCAPPPPCPAPQAGEGSVIFPAPQAGEGSLIFPAPQAGEGREGAGPDDDAVILFTSGTSDRPKGVVLSFREYLLNIDPLAEGFGVTAEDRLYDFRPFSWASAQLLGALAVVNRGATLVLAEKFSASRFFAHLRDHGVTIAAGNPTTINILLNGESTAHRDNLPKLRFVTSSSAPLMLEQWKRFEQRFGIPIAQGCGASEVSWIAAIPGEQRRLGTVGRPFAYHDVAIVDAVGARLAPGEIGFVEVGGLPDHPFRYLGEDGEIKIHCRGRFRTGDLGCLDADGFLMLTGRDKEQIIRGGAKISPVEIDSCLMQRSDVIEAATVGVPDPIYGEEVVSYVVARPGAKLDADELLRYCATVLPAFKAPKQIVLSPSLPKTERGKLDRRALAQRWKPSNRRD